jgi:hypothetical protein
MQALQAEVPRLMPNQVSIVTFPIPLLTIEPIEIQIAIQRIDDRRLAVTTINDTAKARERLAHGVNPRVVDEFFGSGDDLTAYRNEHFYSMPMYLRNVVRSATTSALAQLKAQAPNAKRAREAADEPSYASMQNDRYSNPGPGYRPIRESDDDDVPSYRSESLRRYAQQLLEEGREPLYQSLPAPVEYEEPLYQSLPAPVDDAKPSYQSL